MLLLALFPPPYGWLSNTLANSQPSYVCTLFASFYPHATLYAYAYKVATQNLVDSKATAITIVYFY